MDTHPALDNLDRLIASRSILKHPFYQAWQRGDLTHGQLAAYAEIYYPHVAAFPGYLEAAIEMAGDAEVRAELQDNLADELSNPKAHNELWLDFAEGLGLERESVSSAGPRAAARTIVEKFEGLSRGESGEALAALYAYESQQPEVSKQKMDGLRQFYGVDDPATLAYFKVHAVADLEHREGERQALSRLLENGTTAETIYQAAEQALTAYWGLLDGICTAADIPCE